MLFSLGSTVHRQGGSRLSILGELMIGVVAFAGADRLGEGAADNDDGGSHHPSHD